MADRVETVEHGLADHERRLSRLESEGTHEWRAVARRRTGDAWDRARAALREVGVSDVEVIVGRTAWAPAQIIGLLAWARRLSIGSVPPYTTALIRTHILSRDPGCPIGSAPRAEYIDAARRLRQSDAEARAHVSRMLEGLSDAALAEWRRIAPTRVSVGGGEYAPGMTAERPCQIDVLTGYRPPVRGRPDHRQPWWPSSVTEAGSPEGEIAT